MLMKGKMMEIINLDSLVRFSPEKYVRAPIRGTEGLVRLLCFEPHQTVPVHRHPDADEIFYVLKGEGEATVGSEQARVRESFFVRAPAGVSHGWRNGESQLVLISCLIRSANYELAEQIARMEFV